MPSFAHTCGLTLALDSMRHTIDRAPNVHAILANGMSNYRRADGVPQRLVSLVADIEAEIETPIIGSDISLYWAIFQTLGIEPIGRHGFLLSSLQQPIEP